MENKTHLALILVTVAITLVFFSRSIGQFLFHLFDQYLSKKSQTSYDDFDQLVEDRKRLFSKNSTAPQRRNENPGPPKRTESPKLLEEATDEAGVKRKETVKRIYGLENKRLPQENDLVYFTRFLKLKDNFSKEDLKKTYKELAQLYHPDKFDLTGFDEKTKKKLAAKTHENFVLVQKAYDYLKKI